jgi:glycosyltransferase involved in cell wall biosynthesis
MGGIGHATLHLIDHLCRSRSSQDQLTILTGPDIPDHLSAHGATVVQFDAGMIDPHFEQHQLPHTLDFLNTDVYLNMTFSVPAIAGRTAQVAVIHDVVFEEHPELVEPQLGQYLRRWSRVAATVADRIITVSDDARRRIQRAYGIADNRIVRIYNGMIPISPVPSDDPAVSDALRRHHLHPPFLIYLGSIEPKKGILPLLHAWDDPKLDGVYRTLAFVGLPSGPTSDLDQSIQHHRRTSDIRRLGYVTERDKHLLLAGAQTMVYPSLYEGFGLPPLEALAHGIPCVVHDGTSLPEVVGGIGVVVDVLNRPDFVSALIQAGTDPQLRERVRRLGPGHAANFRWDTASRQYWRVCHQAWDEHQAHVAVA